MSFLDCTFIVMIVLMGFDLLISPYTEGSPLSLLLTAIIILLAFINVIGSALEQLFIKDSSKKEVNNSSEEQHVILGERPLPKDNSISLKCTVSEDGSYLCKKK